MPTMSVAADPENQNNTCVIRLKGVPPKATAEDVLTFFDGLDIDESSIRLNFKERRGAGEVRLSVLIGMHQLSPSPFLTRPFLDLDNH